MSHSEQLSIDTPPDLTIEQRVAAIVGPCPRCGKVHVYATRVQEEIIEVDVQLEHIDPELREQVNRLEVWCTPCITAAQNETRDERRAHRIGVLRRRTYGSDLMPAVAKDMTFAESKPEIEDNNSELWKTLHTFPLKSNLWCMGIPGTGKTFAARCVLNAYLDAGRTVAELSAHRLDEIGRGWKPEQDLKQYADVNLLLIEDLDKPVWHAEGLAALWRLVDMRATSKRQLIITANATPEQVSVIWRQVRSANTTSITSLFERMLPMQRLRFEGQSLRGQTGQGDG